MEYLIIITLAGFLTLFVYFQIRLKNQSKKYKKEIEDLKESHNLQAKREIYKKETENIKLKSSPKQQDFD